MRTMILHSNWRLQVAILMARIQGYDGATMAEVRGRYCGTRADKSAIPLCPLVYVSLSRVALSL